ncbi:Hsp20/alpha crystallin family protein [Pusillimonas sp. CC-YST705]|uniref:Hsp20/alpha crystallin family protein n=1 Tax=Mesopusillimonas faecipullorum TaxID=2755040 RepID=A0ABS8CAF9_9BURK|nr:Hsp20/alpha crystallin family protein [Mesopusillimonas faecipullorum]MCB5363021.1 Hsp20/alpha crystallin family protein [Mesopusillimonas faecipullorum]
MTYRKSPGLVWAQAVGMLEQADRLHRQFFQLGQSPARGPTWEPPADVFETPTHLSVLVALPGVASDRVDILVEGSTLRVVGERPMPAPASAHIRRLEIPYGRFERRIELPAGQFEIQESSLVNGCLVLTLRKL